MGQTYCREAPNLGLVGLVGLVGVAKESGIPFSGSAVVASFITRLCLSGT